jgi:hypothetical protein
MNLSDRMVATIRTLVPALWAAALAWLLRTYALPTGFASVLNGIPADALVPVVLGGWYWLTHKLTSWSGCPRWVTLLLFGIPAAPHYGTSK